MPAHAVAIKTGVQPQPLGPAVPPPQVLNPEQVLAQVTAWPQLFVAGPQALPAQAAVLLGVQPQPLGPALPAPQVLTPVQVLGQWTAWPQLPVAGPHALPVHVTVIASGTHWHWVTVVPAQASAAAHGVHRVVSPQPLLASVGTQLLPHFLVPVPQVPTTQAPAWQIKVPVPALGQVDASHVEAPQP